MPRSTQQSLTRTEAIKAIFREADEYGHATSDDRYTLVAEHGAGLTVGRRQQFAVFGQPDPPEVEWVIYDLLRDVEVARLAGSDRLDWVPDAPGWFEVSCAPSPNRPPLALLQRAVALPSIERLQAWARALIPPDPAPGPVVLTLDDYLANGAWLGDPETTGDLLTRAWEWIYTAAIRQGSGRYPARLLAAVVLRIMLQDRVQTPEGLNAGLAQVMFMQTEMDEEEVLDYGYVSVNGAQYPMREDPPATAREWSEDAAVGFAQLIPSVAAGMLGLYPQRTDVPRSGAPRERVLTSLRESFASLSVETRFDVLNVLRFGRSSVCLLGRELAAVVDGAAPAVAGDALLKEANENVLRSLLDTFHLRIGVADPRATEKTLGLVRLPVLSAFFPLHGYPAPLPARNIDPLRLPANAPDTVALASALREVGIEMAGPGGTVNQSHEISWSIREFQIYARGNDIAVEDQRQPPESNEYWNRLACIPNLYPYQGPVSGIANADTRRLLDIWRALRWRIPRVISAWTVQDGQRTQLMDDNIWRRAEPGITQPRVFSLDLRSVDRSPSWVPVGEWTSSRDGDGPHANAERHSLPQAEITPSVMAGHDITWAQEAEASTFKVVRAVSESECQGYLDVFNAYDDEHYSAGIFHFTVSRTNNGEFGGILSRIRAEGTKGKGSYDRFVRSVGLNAAKMWPFAHSRGAYRSELQLEDERGRFQTPANPYLAWFSTWHRIAHFQDAFRSDPNFQRVNWIMARLRLEAILYALYPPDAQGRRPQILKDGVLVPARIGQVFTSEQSVALLLRWHVWRPSHVLDAERNKAGEVIHYHMAEVLDAAIPPYMHDVDVTNFNDQDEKRLIAAILQHAEASYSHESFQNTLADVKTWPGPTKFPYQLNPLQLMPPGPWRPTRLLSSLHGSFRFWPVQP